MRFLRTLLPMRYERLDQPVLPAREFFLRIGRNLVLAGCLVAISLGIGIVGYHQLEGMPWIDAYLNAAMILSGMGPTSELHHAGAKIFAGLCALCSGFLVIAVFGIVLAPALHRLLHRLHAEEDEKE